MRKFYSLLLLGGLLLFGELPVFATTYTVAGMKEFAGVDWAADAVANDMTLQDGVYVKVFNNVSLTADFWYMYKICENHSWDVTYTNGSAGEGNSYNSYFSVGASGAYDIMIIFDPSKKEEAGQGVSDKVCTHTVKLAGSFTEWETSALVMTRADDFNTCSVSYDFSAGSEVDFKIVIVGDADTWLGTTNSTITVANSGEKFYLDKANVSGYNCSLSAILEGRYTFTYTYATGQLAITYPTTYTRSGLTAGAYGTLCLPVDGTVTGATLYNIAGKDASVLYLTENSNPTYATRGVPYIFKLGNSDTEISVALNNSYYTNTAGTANGLHGVYTDQAFEAPFNITYTYIVTNTEIQKASAASGVHANRAYIELNDIYGGAPAPGRPIIAMPLGENGATSIDAIEATEKAVKFVENGKLLIKKNGVVYDTTGRVVR